MSKVRGDLPGTRPVAAGGGPALVGANLAGLVRALTNARGPGARERRDGDEREPKPPFAFAGAGLDDLSSGCKPSSCSYAGAKAHQEANEVASVAYQLDQGGNQATLADVRSIRDKEKIRLPWDLHQVAVTLQRYAGCKPCSKVK
jgi:hypothetical protein